MLRFLPPLTISDDLLAEAFMVLRDGFADSLTSTKEPTP